MLTSAWNFKETITRYGNQNHCWLPTSEKWERAGEVCKSSSWCHECIFGTKHPTANTFLTKIVGILDFQNKKWRDNNAFVQAIAVKMKEKLDKYWGECHLVMAAAAVWIPVIKWMFWSFLIQCNISGIWSYQSYYLCSWCLVWAFQLPCWYQVFEG
jgi:hypothetical protein